MPSRYKKLIIGALLFLLSSFAHGQLMSDGRFARLMFRDSLEFQTNWLNSFTLDTSLSGATIKQFAPVKTVKDYIDNHIRSSSYFSDRGVKRFTDPTTGANIFRIQDTLDDPTAQSKFLWNYDNSALRIGYDESGLWTASGRSPILPNTSAIGNSLIVNASGGVALGNYNTGVATSPVACFRPPCPTFPCPPDICDSVLFQLGNGTSAGLGPSRSDALTIFRSGAIQSNYYSNGDPTKFLTTDNNGNFILGTPAGGGGGTNFANADLTATGERTHNFAHNGMLIGNLDYLDMVAMGTDGTVAPGDNWSATSSSQIYSDTSRITLVNQNAITSSLVSISDSTVIIQASGVTKSNFVNVLPDKFLFRQTSADDTRLVINKIPETSTLPGYIAVFEGDTLKKASASLVSGRSYKIYRALLFDYGGGTTDPAVIELENTLGATISWTRTGVGIYRGTSSVAGIFGDLTTFYTITPRATGTIETFTLSPFTSFVVVNTYSGNTLTDGLMNYTPVEIDVYP